MLYETLGIFSHVTLTFGIGCVSVLNHLWICSIQSCEHQLIPCNGIRVRTQNPFLFIRVLLSRQNICDLAQYHHWSKNRWPLCFDSISFVFSRRRSSSESALRESKDEIILQLSSKKLTKTSIWSSSACWTTISVSEAGIVLGRDQVESRTQFDRRFSHGVRRRSVCAKVYLWWVVRIKLGSLLRSVWRIQLRSCRGTLVRTMMITSIRYRYKNLRSRYWHWFLVPVISTETCWAVLSRVLSSCVVLLQKTSVCDNVTQTEGHTSDTWLEDLRVAAFIQTCVIQKESKTVCTDTLWVMYISTQTYASRCHLNGNDIRMLRNYGDAGEDPCAHRHYHEYALWGKVCAPEKMCSKFSSQKIAESNVSCAWKIDHRALCGISCVLRPNLVFGQWTTQQENSLMCSGIYSAKTTREISRWTSTNSSWRSSSLFFSKRKARLARLWWHTSYPFEVKERSKWIASKEGLVLQN